MWHRSTIAIISKDVQSRQMSALSKRMRNDFSSYSSSASEDGDGLKNPNLSATECMQGLAQKRSQKIDFELQDYIRISGSSSPSPSSSPSTVSKKLASSASSSSSSSSLSYSPQSHVKDETENFFSKTWANIKQSRPSVLHDSSSKIRNRERTRQSLQTNRSIDSDSVVFRDLPSHPRVWKRALVTENCQESFVITSFNVLASTYAHQHRSLYPHVPDVLLSWGRRKTRILQELDFASPDIICLQEVDRFRDLAEELTSRGYVGLFKLRTGAMPDGCAIFWRKARFQLLQERSFEFSMLGMRNNVAQLCVLEPVKPGTINAQSSTLRMAESIPNRRLIVGNIHVLFNPKRGEIKLGQCRAFLEQVHNMSSVWQGAPVVIGGDFNSTPSSAVYKFLATSTLDLSNLDRRYLSGQTVETVVDCKLLPKASLQHEHLKESHEIPLRSHVTTQIEENKLSIQNERAGEWFTSVASTLSAKSGRDGNLENYNPSEGRSMNYSVKHTEIKLEESHFSASSGSEHLVAERCNLSITESNIQQGKCSQWATSDYTDTHSTDNKYCSLASGVSKDDAMVQEKPKWELEELRVATGKIDCTVMHHNLNLCSVYSEVPGQPNTRDAIGEPLLTTCHKEFTGTVDYIWRSDGLKTMKVLDTVPLNTFARNKGLPLKLWGSDHLPISCELAFAQEI